MDALEDLKRLKRKGGVFFNELNDLRTVLNENSLWDNGYKEILQFLLEHAETGRADKRRRADPALARVDQEQTVKRQRQMKSKGVVMEGASVGTTSRGQPQRDVQAGENTPKQVKPKEANRILLIEVKAEKESHGKTPKKGKVTEKRAQNKKGKVPVQSEVKVEGQKTGKSTTPLSKQPEYIEIDYDDEVLTEPAPENNGTSVNRETVDKNKTPDTKDGMPEKSPQEMKSQKVIKIEDDNNKDAYTPVEGTNGYQSPSNDNRDILAFRNEVLTVQGRPFNLEEYSRLQEAIIAGSYLDHYQDLKRLLLSQYKREKRLAILRGFFFWLQNLTRKGAFRPWNDCVCLEVDPPHVG